MPEIRGYLTSLQATFDRLPIDSIEAVIELLRQARFDRRKIFILGNGGSASTATHFVCDLAKNTRVPGWPDFRVYGLADNMALLTAFANDEGYESVFESQLASLVEPGDLVIGISTSGNSANVLNAARLARRSGATVIGFTGYEGGQLGALSHVHLNVPSDSIEQIEDVHLILEHLICKALREYAQATPYPPAVQVKNNREFLRLLGQDAEFSVNASEIMDAIGRELKNSKSRFAFLSKALHLCVQTIGAASGSIIVLDEAGRIAEGLVEYDGEVRRQDTEQLADTLQRGLAGWVVRQREAALVTSTYGDQRWLRRNWEQAEESARSAISVPLVVESDVVGVLTVVNRRGSHFMDIHLAIMSAIATYLTMSSAEMLTANGEEYAVVDVGGQVDGRIVADPDGH